MIDDPLSFLPVAYRAAAEVVRCRVLAEEAGERAFHLFTLAVMQGCPPDHPKAWLRCVAKRSALALLRSDWAKQRNLEHADQVPYRGAANSEREYGAGVDFVRETLPASLSRRQQEALAAAVSCNTTRAAARRCGMQPRDFRRSLSAISRRAREILAERCPGDHGAILEPPLGDG